MYSRLVRQLRSASDWIARHWLFLTLMLATVLLLARLDDSYLWQDEAETALIARNMLTYGLPLSTDGRTWVQQEEVPFREFTSDYVWIYHPWMQYAASALSFEVLGTSTFAARLPFVLAGLASILLLYRLSARSQPDSRVARLSALLLALSVPAILLARQCRYYAVSSALTLLVLDSYLSLDSAKQWSMPCFVLASALLFHTEYAAFFPGMAAVTVHALLLGRKPVPWKQLLPGLMLVALLTLPWTALIPVWHAPVTSGAGSQLAASRLSRMVLRAIGIVGEQGLQITAWILPLLLLPAVALGVRANLSKRPAHCQNTRLWSLLVLLIAAHILSLSLVGWSFFRYLSHIIPLLLLLTAVGLIWLVDLWRPLGYAVIAVFLTTNLLHILPYRAVAAAIPRQSPFWQAVQSSPATRWISGIQALNLRSDPLMYAQELTHQYSGPTEGLVAYLAANARPGQSVLANYEDLPLQFYTDLTVYGGMSGRGLDDGIQPDWVIDRQYGHYRDQIAALVGRGLYERIIIPYPDLRWENREEPGKHQYLTASTESPVVLYRRIVPSEPGRSGLDRQPVGRRR